MIRAALLGCVLSALVAAASGEVQSGSVSGSSFAFLGKFCFDYDPSGTPVGSISWVINGATEDTALWLYDDEDSSWPAISRGMTCEERLPRSRIGPVVLSPSGIGNITIVEVLRPRLWRVVAARLDCAPISIQRYQVTFLNRGSHFGYGMHIMPVLYSAAAAVLLALVVVVCFQLRRRARDWLLARMVILAMIVQLLHALLFMIDWIMLGQSGVGAPLLNVGGIAAQCVASAAIWLAMALASTGVGISGNEVKRAINRASAAFVMAFVMAFIATAVWYEIDQDPASATAVYDTPAGYVLVVVNLAFVIWWGICTFNFWRGAQDEMGKRISTRTFLPFLALLLVIPVCCLLGALVAPWDRQQTMVIVKMSCIMASYTSLGFILCDLAPRATVSSSAVAFPGRQTRWASDQQSGYGAV